MSIQTEINRIVQNVADAYDAVEDKGGTIPNTKTSGNLFAAIQSIPTSSGVEVKVATGTVTGVSGSAKTVNCGFQPDAVFFTGTNLFDNKKTHAGVAFKEDNVTSTQTVFVSGNSNYIFSTITVNRTSTGFSVSGIRVNTSLQQSNESNRSLSYIAIKYT